MPYGPATMPLRHVPVLMPASATVGGRLKLVQVRTIRTTLATLEVMTPSQRTHAISIPQKPLYGLSFGRREQVGADPLINSRAVRALPEVHALLRLRSCSCECRPQIR